MKGTSWVATILLFVAIAVLYVLHFTGKNGGKGTNGEEGEATEQQDVRIAYIKADSLILNYDLSQVLHDEFTKKQEAFTSEYGSKGVRSKGKRLNSSRSCSAGFSHRTKGHPGARPAGEQGTGDCPA